MRRPRRPAKAGGCGGGGEAPVEAVGVKGAAGLPVIAVDGEGEAPLLGFPVAAAAGGGEDEAPVVEGVQPIAVKGNGKAEKDEDGIKWLKHYSSAQSILIVGDGDFSFSLALATAFGSAENLVATSLDSYGALTSKYGKAEANVTELKRLGATVLHGVDAKTMKLHSCLKMRRFDRIVFNFPHAGFKGKEDQLHVINAHKQLVHGFFANARYLLRPYGETHVSHKTGRPYDTWDIEQLAYDSCLIRVRTVAFSKEDYPGYNQKRGASAKCDQPFALGPCCTFMFCLGDVKKLKKVHGNMIGSIPFLGDSKFYPGVSAAGMSQFDLRPHALAWPQPHFPPVNTVHMPIPFVPQPFGVAPIEHPGFTVNFSGAERAPYFHQQQDLVQPMCRGQPLKVLPTQCGFRPPTSRVLANPEQPPVVPPWGGDYSYSPGGYQGLQREYEIHRQHTLSLEHRYIESVQRRARLEMLIAHYGSQ
ncbi:uncharacterized protein [Lolium perenne]|uniref:uncharacterized protein n=1 Tax=Lolium perenne TaxID=4522 RepID=UPI0021F55E54|nr:uncharacterized protein LOC127302009 [Lolium perenne]